MAVGVRTDSPRTAVFHLVLTPAEPQKLLGSPASDRPIQRSGIFCRTCTRVARRRHAETRQNLHRISHTVPVALRRAISGVIEQPAESIVPALRNGRGAVEVIGAPAGARISAITAPQGSAYAGIARGAEITAHGCLPAGSNNIRIGNTADKIAASQTPAAGTGAGAGGPSAGWRYAAFGYTMFLWGTVEILTVGAYGITFGGFASRKHAGDRNKQH